MSKTVRGHGGGGDKGSGGSVYTPVESPDSIRSKQFARVVDLLCEGEIEGLVNGSKSIYLDETPLQNTDGSYNFSSVSYSTRNGTQDQMYLEGYPSVEAEQNVSVEVKYATPVTRQISNANTNRIRITMALPSLYQQQTNGDLTGATVQYKFELQSNGGGFVPIYLGWAWSRYTSTASTYTTGSCTGLEVGGTVTVPLGVGDVQQTGTFELQYKSTSSGVWTTLVTKTFSSGYWTSENTEQGPSLLFTAQSDTGISGSITNLTYDTYNVRIVNTSGAGTGVLDYVSTLQKTEVVTISDKTTSRYQRNHEITLTGEAPWDIRVTRVTADSTSAALQNKTTFESYTEIIDAKLSYPNSALVGISVDASQFSRIPTRAYDVKLLKVKIPSNYDPLTRAYTGIWDGTFTVAWTDNPAWCFYDLLTNTRYGLGSYIDTTLVDTAQLYQIAQYCDELVPNGYGGTEPRFTCNIYLQTREEAYKVIGNMASIFRGMTYWSTGSIFAVQDAPEDVFSQFTNADVINGEFTYSGSAGNTRHSVALITWNDPSDSYKQKIEYVEDAEAIARFGIRETEQIAIGCTSRGQAHRMGRWILYTEKYETEVTAFKTGLKGTAILPGKIIQTMDNNRAGVRFGGRIISATTTSATLDSSVTIESGKTYNISLVLPEGTIEERAVTNGVGAATVITWTTALPTTPQAYSIWILTASDLTVEKWRVLAVTEESKGIYSVNAVSHYDQKYALVEDNINFEGPQTSYLTTTQAPVTNLSVSDSLYYITQDVIGVKMVVSWTPPQGAIRYQISYKTANAPTVTLPSTYPSIDILNVSEGSYDISVTAYNAIGVPSLPTSTTYTVLGRYVSPSVVTNFRISVVGENSYLSWDAIDDLDLSHYQIKFSPVLTGATWSSSNILVEKVGKPATSITVPTMSGTYLIKAVDYYSMYSENEALISSNIAGLLGFNAVESVTEHPTFSGTKVDIEVVNNTLQIISADMLEDWLTLDSVTTLRYGINGIFNYGEYYFTNTVDLGQVFTSRVTSNLLTYADDLANVMVQWATLTSVESLNSSKASDWGVTLQIRTTSDDPGGTPTWSAWQNFIIGDYNARAFEFRLLMEAYLPNVSPVVEELEVFIDMPDRVYGENDLVCGATGLTVTYSPAFNATPSIAIAAQGLQTWDYYEITAKTATGFTIIFKDSGGSGVSRTFDYVAKGYGYLTT